MKKHSFSRCLTLAAAVLLIVTLTGCSLLSVRPQSSIPALRPTDAPSASPGSLTPASPADLSPASPADPSPVSPADPSPAVDGYSKYMELLGLIEAGVSSSTPFSYGSSATGYYTGGMLSVLDEYPAVFDGEIDDNGDPKYSATNEFANCESQFLYDYFADAVVGIFLQNYQTGAQYCLFFENGRLTSWVDNDLTLYTQPGVGRWNEMESYYEHAISQCRNCKDMP